MRMYRVGGGVRGQESTVHRGHVFIRARVYSVVSPCALHWLLGPRLGATQANPTYRQSGGSKFRKNDTRCPFAHYALIERLFSFLFPVFFFFFPPFLFPVAVYGMVRVDDVPGDAPGRRFESSAPFVPYVWQPKVAETRGRGG